MIKELIGKSKEKDEEAYVYSEEGEKKNIEEMKDEYLDRWKKEIYQKTERINLSWYGKAGLKGKKEEMEEEEEKGESGIMKLPIMEEEMIDIRKMKNGKAAGIDGIRAELIKHIIKMTVLRNTW